MSTHRQSWNDLTKGTICAVAAVLLGPAFFVTEIVPGLVRLHRSVAVPGRVERTEVTAEVDGKGRNSYRPRVFVRYAWEGQEHLVDYLPREALDSSRRRERVEERLRELPVGAEVRVWVDPAAPASGSQSRSFPRWICALLVGFAAALRLAADSYAQALERRRRRRAEELHVAALDPAPVEVEGFLAPRGTFTAMFVVPAGAAVVAYQASQPLPYLSVALLVASAAVAVVPWWRFLPEARAEWRWRRARLHPSAARAAGAVEHELRGVPAGPLELELAVELAREERDPVPEGRVRRLVDAWLGNDWTPALVVAERAVDATREGDLLRFSSEAEPFGPIDPVPGWDGAERPLVVEGRERRLRVRLVVREGERRVAFLWATSV